MDKNRAEKKKQQTTICRANPGSNNNVSNLLDCLKCELILCLKQMHKQSQI